MLSFSLMLSGCPSGTTDGEKGKEGIEAISLTADAVSGKKADGVDAYTLTATIIGADAAEVGGKRVTFEAAGATGSVTVSPAFGYTDSAGSVSCIVTDVSNIDDTVTVSASSAGVESDDVVLSFAGSEVVTGQTLTLAASPGSIIADGVSTSMVTAILKEGDGTPIPGVPVIFNQMILDSETYNLPAGNTYKGTGSTATPFFYSYGGNATFTVSHTGDGYYAVLLWNASQGQEALLASGTGLLVDAEVTEALDGGTYFIEVITGADATWSVQAEGSIAEEGATDEDIVRQLAVVTTDANGRAEYLYTSDTVKKEVIIEGVTGELSAEASITQTAGNVTTVDVFADENRIYANGTSTTEILAVARDAAGNRAEDGTVVQFSATRGSVTVQAMTEEGSAGAVLNASESAVTVTSTVGASAGTGTDTVDVTFVGVSLADMRATPDTIYADGTDTAAVTVRLKDQNGSAVEGETIVFFTTGGTVQPGSVETNNGGLAAVTLIAPSADGNATVTAGYGLIKKQVTVTFTTEPPERVGSIMLSAGSSSLLANGTSSTLITADVRNTGNEAVADGTVVAFSTSAGTISDVTTTVQGIATALLTSSTKTGTASIVVSAGGINNSTAVTFIPGPPAVVQVSASPMNLTADGDSTSVVRAEVSDAHGNPVSQETVTFKSLEGIFENGGKTFTTATEDGVAVVTYTSPSAVPASGKDTITAETVNNKKDSTLITLIGPQIAGIELSANPTSLPADGASQATISAALTVVGGGAAPDGTAVSFSITAGGGSITPEANTAAGVAIATLTSGSTAETATIRAEAGGRTAEINIEYKPGSVTVTIIPNSLLGTGEATAVVTATLQKSDGSPADDGDTVDFTLNDQNLGAVVPASAVTAGGQAQVSFEAATVGGTATVTATWNTGGVDVTGSADISIQPPPAFIENAEDSPDPASIDIKGTGGQSTSLITFDVKDIGGQPVADGYRIDFAILDGPNGGEEISPVRANTVNGQVGTILRSGYKSGPVSIKAVYHQNTNVSTIVSQIAISSGPPVGEEFGLSAEYRNISGLVNWDLEDGITAYVSDYYGNPVPDGTAISFKTYATGGSIIPGDGQTVDGRATNTLISDPPAAMEGFLQVTAEANNGGRTTHVTALEVTPYPDNNILYAGTNGGGIYKSTDSGATWTNISRSFENPKAGRNWIDPYIKGQGAISVDPDNYNTIYVGTGYLGKGNLYRSLDQGMNWNSNNEEEWYGLLSVSQAILSVLCDGGGSDYVWAGTEGLGALFAPDGESFQWGGEASVPVPDPLNTGDGIMTQSLLSSTSKTEAWETLYYVPDDATATAPVAGTTNIGTGFMTSVTTDKTATLTETWTIRLMSVSPDTWLVEGSASGIQAGTATTGIPYTSDGNEVSFTIYAGGTAFVVDDRFTFTTTAASRPYWIVNGTVSGFQTRRAYNGMVYTSDNSEVTFLIVEGATPFAEGDGFTFDTVESGLGYGKVVRDIVKVPGTHGDTAVLYAATNTGVFRSDNGGIIWNECANFTGDFITTIALHPDSTGGAADVIYVGTEDAGVHVSTDSGNTWTKYAGGMGGGLNASTPLADPNNTGNGIMSAVTVDVDATLSEEWTVTCVTEAANGGTFSVKGTVSGDQTAQAAVGVPYTSDGDEVVFTILDGSIDYALGDTFTFRTTRDPGTTIRDLLVDAVNERLYAATYFWGALEPHAIGNVYYHELEADGSMAVGDWQPAHMNDLPQYDPPDDVTLFAQHVLALDDPDNPGALFVGGEGINLYKATAGLDAGIPVWNESMTGLTNLIMARMPILFTGVCTMDIREEREGDVVTYTVYIEDENGNPPIMGTVFTVEGFDSQDKLLITYRDVTYPDTYTHEGTFRDPADVRTNNPYIIQAVVYPSSAVVKVVFTFSPTCEDEAPGCSGSRSVVSFPY